MYVGRLIAIVLLGLGCVGCQPVVGVTVLAYNVASAPFDAVRHESLNHHFTMAGTVVDQDGNPLDDVTAHIWSVTPEQGFDKEDVTVNKAFGFDRHGRQILLWFTKNGYRDAKLALVPEGTKLESQFPTSAEELEKRSDRFFPLGYDTVDAEFHVGQEQTSLKVVLPRHTPGKLRTITAELSASQTVPAPALCFTKEKLPPGKWMPSAEGEKNPTFSLMALDGQNWLQGLPLLAAEQQVQRLEDMPICPMLPYLDSARIELNAYKTKPVPEQPYFFFARIGLCYARGMVTLHSADASNQHATLVLQIQEDGSREFR